MLVQLVLVVFAATATIEGKSPNADYIDALVKSSKKQYSNDVIEDAKLGMEDLVSKYGYPIESYSIITEDDYILTMHRIPHGRDRNNQKEPNKTVVFLMHGLVASSSCYVLLGPENGLAYLLAEEGYDVFMGNARGSYYSRRHKTYNPDSRTKKSFWKFSWDEIGNYDLPAFLNYIETVTGQSQLHYIGHSQGGTAYLVLNALRPEYNKKFISFQGLAPAVFFQHNSHPVSMLTPLAGIIEPAVFTFDTGEVYQNRGLATWYSTNFCKEFLMNYGWPLCQNFMMTGLSATSDQSLTPVLFGHAPAGASIHQLAHFAQVMRSNSFRRFNHDWITNLRVYGTSKPPVYDVTLATAPAYLHCAENDTLVNIDDVKLLASKMKNVKAVHVVESKEFDHVDFIWSKDAKRLVYDIVIADMKDAEGMAKDEN